ncbi:MAG: serine--tRNA ligase [Candidatus Hydrogenedentota bacterium]
MIDIKYIRDNAYLVRAALQRRQHRGLSVEQILQLDDDRRALQHQTDQARAEQNTASKEIAKLKKEGRDDSAALASVKELSEKVKRLIEESDLKKKELDDALLTVPNFPHESVPSGADASANRVVRTWGEPKTFDFEPLDHVALGEKLGLLDLERAAKLSGARFALTYGMLARLERALINFMLDVHTREHGYTEVAPPFMVNSAAMQGTGQLPKFAEDSFKIEGRDLWLVPTAEVPLTNIHADEILEGDDLPKYFTAYTPCFRSEAGSYGKDTRGLIRQHQFNKVELVKLCKPEDSYDELEKLTANAEVILQRLELPYRIVTLSTGDMGFSAAKTYDIEVWLPSQNTYREISSCSNCTDFQARRANIRFRRDKGAKPEHVHTLNGSGVAAGRALIALMENHQQADGNIQLPSSLAPYLNGERRISR